MFKFSFIKKLNMNKFWKTIKICLDILKHITNYNIIKSVF